jgi:hypothetical protein
MMRGRLLALNFRMKSVAAFAGKAILGFACRWDVAVLSIPTYGGRSQCRKGLFETEVSCFVYETCHPRRPGSATTRSRASVRASVGAPAGDLQEDLPEPEQFQLRFQDYASIWHTPEL